MKNKIKLLTTFILVVYSYYSYGQSDSTYHDLGRLKLRKEFTQSISIQGADLDKFAFTNLSDAINAWLYGTLSNDESLVYVIDGILVNDVNAYSIQDIEDITLVQNALIQLNGVKDEQHLVLINTKKSITEGLHITGGAQVSYVTKTEITPINSDDSKSADGLFHQYFLSAKKRKNGLNAGVTASYLRDIYPVTNNTIKPYSMGRVRLNGYLEKYLTKNTSLKYNLNFTPQKLGYQTKPIWMEDAEREEFRNRQRLLSTGIALKTLASNGLMHIISFTYSSLRGNSKLASYLNSGFDSQIEPFTSTSTNKSYDFLLKDDVHYERRLGQFGIRPALNLTFRYGRLFETMENKIGNDDLLLMNSAYSLDYKSLLLTPSVNFHFRNALNLQGGLLLNFSYVSYLKENHNKIINPFVSATADIVKLVAAESNTGFKLFSSFALSDISLDHTNSLTDLNNSIPTNFNNDALFSKYLNSNFANKVFQIGGSVSFDSDKFIFTYNYDNRNYSAPVLINKPNTNGFEQITAFYDGYSQTHRASINVSIFKKPSYRWYSGLSYARRKLTLEDLPKQVNTYFEVKPWHGGWVNRVQYKNLGFGFDILYRLKEEKGSYINENGTPGYTVREFNTITLQNIYLSYGFKILKLKVLEVYANSRNLALSKDTSLTDNRRYMGVGFKIDI
ncbi:MAG TPA: hypothetical protein VD908_01290 [Cytophagales bacterium]|nr:hypothetical protein [Cytophagales bacterium]